MKPERIFLVRHGESVGNIDRSIYNTLPDYALELTEKGRQQARDVGNLLNQIIGKENIQFYISPFWRTRQTYLGIVDYFYGKNSYKVYEDPRIREQEWGQCRNIEEGFRDSVETERDAYGHFYYRFEGGESCADVFDRVSDFMNTMFRDFQKEDYARNVVIITHGMALRLFLMRWLHKPVEEFESWANPKNCEYKLLERNNNGKYNLTTELKTHTIRHPYQFDWYKYKGLAEV